MKALRAPEVLQTARARPAVERRPERFERQFRSDIAKFVKVVRDTGIPPDSSVAGFAAHLGLAGRSVRSELHTLF